VQLDLGGRAHDLTSRALVIGVLNRTRDSFYDPGAHLELDRLLRRAEQLARDGADVLEVGARPGGVGVEPVPADVEAELAAETLQHLRRRFELPLAVDTQRAAVAAAAFAAGAVLGNDMSGFRDDAYLGAAAAAGAAVIATHCRLPPGVPDPDPVYADLVEDVAAALRVLAGRALAAGIPADRIVLDPGYDLGKTWRQTLTLLGHTPRFAALGHPLMVAVSHKIFLGRVLDLPMEERGTATVAACAYAITRGARVVRVHDARAGRQVANLLAALWQAEDER
jgi:dihydropteroate synthase